MRYLLPSLLMLLLGTSSVMAEGHAEISVMLQGKINAIMTTLQDRNLDRYHRDNRIKEIIAPIFSYQTMAKLSLDLSGPYPQTLSGNKYIAGFVCWYSSWIEAFSLPNKEAATIAHLIIEEIFPRFGCPLQIVTDNGTENVNRIMKEVLTFLNVDHVRTSVAHQQSNSKIERAHRTLHDILAKKVSENQETWDPYLNQALAAIRFNVNESSKLQFLKIRRK